MKSATIVGDEVIVRSAAGIEYAGHVRSIRQLDDGGELFELGRYGDVAYQRFVYVSDRALQVRAPGRRSSEAHGIG
jgi:hypothetical protein